MTDTLPEQAPIAGAPPRGLGLPFLILAAACALLFFARLGVRDLWEPDEPNFALTAREMLESRNFALPTLNGKPEGEKPPMMYWAVAAASVFTGGQVTELSTRLPSAAGMWIVVMLVALAGARLFGARAGWIAGTVMATCHIGIWEARVGQVDALNCMFVTIAFLAFQRGLEPETPAVRWLAVAWAASGFAVLTKGHPGCILPILTALVWGLLTRGRSSWRRMRWEIGIPIVLAIGCLWLVPLVQVASLDFLVTVLYRQTVVRYFNPWHHWQPPYYYFQTMPQDFLPWTVFLPWVLWRVWREARQEKRPEAIYLLLWIAVVVAYFSASTGKRSIYVLTAFPALALATGYYLDGVLSASGSAAKLFRGSVWAWVGALVVLAFGAPFKVQPLYPDMFLVVFGLTPLLLASALAIVLALSRSRDPADILYLFAGSAFTLFFYLHTFILPTFDPHNSARAFCARTVQTLAPGQDPILYGFFRGTYGFYTGRKFDVPENPDGLAAILVNRPANPALLQQEQFDELTKDPRFVFDVVHRETIGRRKMILARASLASAPAQAPATGAAAGSTAK